MRHLLDAHRAQETLLHLQRAPEDLPGPQQRGRALAVGPHRAGHEHVRAEQQPFGHAQGVQPEELVQGRAGEQHGGGPMHGHRRRQGVVEL